MNNPSINGWLNLYKPLGITSAKAVSAVKHLLPKGTKIGHTGTLDPEAEGVLPLAIGEATKLVQFLMEAQKTYRFKIQFGRQTDTADKEGKVIATTNFIPRSQFCHDICSKFTGEITQIPPKFSALKVQGVRAYELARQNKEVKLEPRKVKIFDLKCLEVDEANATATYIAKCSKGTYIRTLAEDISLSLQSLGFVIELIRTEVGMFRAEHSVNLSDLNLDNILRIDSILVDIPVLDIDDKAAYKIRCGQLLELSHNDGAIWLRHQNKLLAIGKMCQGRFDSARVFNL